jgi:hypothetical protein
LQELEKERRWNEATFETPATDDFAVREWNDSVEQIIPFEGMRRERRF